MSQMDKSDMAVIIARFEDFKDVVIDRLNRIDKRLDERCVTCVNAPTFRERLKSQWFHIMSIWTVIGSYIAYLVIKGK